MVSGGSGSADPGSGGVPRACDNTDSEGTSASGGAEEVEMTRTPVDPAALRKLVHHQRHWALHSWRMVLVP